MILLPVEHEFAAVRQVAYLLTLAEGPNLHGLFKLYYFGERCEPGYDTYLLRYIASLARLRIIIMRA